MGHVFGISLKYCNMVIGSDDVSDTRGACLLMGWVKVAEHNSIKKDSGIECEVEGQKIAVFNQDGIYAMESTCAHQEGSIAPGELKDGVIECPLHFWHYDIKTGNLLDYLKDIKLKTFKVEERNDGIYVEV